MTHQSAYTQPLAPPDTEFMRFLHKRRDASYMARVMEKWRRVREMGAGR